MKRLRASVVAVILAIAATALAAVSGLVGVSVVPDAADAATSTPSYSLGTTTIATPASGRRVIYVATNGTNDFNGRSNGRVECLNAGQSGSSCPDPTASHPLGTIEAGITVAQPGDVVVVRAGSYSERLGLYARQGTSSKPIVLQTYPNERVDVTGYLNLHSANYWTVAGFHFAYGSNTGQQMVVGMFGGTGWTLAHNEIHGSTGVANLLITPDGSASNSTAPHNYTVSSNCIRDNLGSSLGLDHNIYLQSSIYSTGGVISHNLISGAPFGGDIKAGGSNDATTSPRNVQITFNTLLGAASGVIVGQEAENVVIDHNVIGLPQNDGDHDGAVKTYAMVNAAADSVTNNVVSGFPVAVRETGNLTGHIVVSNTIPWNPLSYTGSINGCSVALADNVAERFGHQASSGAVLNPSTNRLSGPDRYNTSAAISSSHFRPGVPVAYVATGLGYADALSAGPAASAGGGPLLLTDPSALPSSIQAELQRLQPQTIVIVGGVKAVSSAVQAQLEQLVSTPSDVTRIAGDDRYQTSVQLAQFAFRGGASVAYLANGANFPDALAAGPAAAHFDGPVVLVPGSASSVPSSTMDELLALGLKSIKIAGGTSAVSTGIQRQVAFVAPVVRFAGADRFQTADLINADAFTGAIPVAFLATGFNFADALSGSALAGAQGAPLYIGQADCVPQDALDQMSLGDTTTASLLGGTAALSAGAANLFSCG